MCIAPLLVGGCGCRTFYAFSTFTVKKIVRLSKFDCNTIDQREKLTSIPQWFLCICLLHPPLPLSFCVDDRCQIFAHFFSFPPPNQQRTLNKLPSELRCRNFVSRHLLSIQIGTKRAKTCTQCVHILTELPFCTPPLVVGHHHPPHTKKPLTNFYFFLVSGLGKMRRSSEHYAVVWGSHFFF